jgi:hypothetical protein
MDAEIRKRLSIKQFKLKKSSKSDKPSNYDELTECYSADYMKTYLKKLKFSGFSKKEKLCFVFKT